MFKRIMGYELSLEVLLVSIIFICLLALLFKIVIPNFGVKSVAASWMTMLGAFIIFAYSVFVELKEESFKSGFNTYICVSDNADLLSFLVPPSYRGDCGLLRYQDSGSLSYLKSDLDKTDVPEVGAELIQINAISYLASDYRDWKSKKYSSPSSYTESYRKKCDAGRDAVILEGVALRNSNFRFFDISPEVAHDFGGYSILPPNSSVQANGSKVILKNPHFVFEIEPFSLQRLYRMDVSTPQNVWVTEYDVRISYTLFKSKSGHWRRSEYRDFCHSLAEGIKTRLEVTHENWPKSKGWGA